MAVNIELRPKETNEIYPCDPGKNVECSKTNCYINGGICTETTNPAYKKISSDIPTNLFELLKKDLLHGNDTCYIKKIEIERHFDHPFLPGSDPDGYEVTVDYKNVVTGNISHARCIVSDSAIVNCDCREQHVTRELDLKIFKED